ncbi:MAG: hypothetical protein KC561_14405 [Myxococcales bacterium]|nr:hypothetical protein [Myxococcales bacterium]
MHDDVFLIMNDGWAEAAKPRKTIEDKERKLAETPDLAIGSGKSTAKYKMDLIPPDLVFARYFSKEKEGLEKFIARAEEASRLVEEFVDEHAVEDGLLALAMDDEKVTKALAVARLREAKREDSDPDEVKALQHLISLYEDEAAAKRAAKDAQAALAGSTLAKYGELSDADVQDLVLDAKWREVVTRRASSEAEALTLALVSRIHVLGDRYAETVSALDQESEELSAKVAGHLAAMGVS